MKTVDQFIHYQICFSGILDDRWRHWFEGLEVKALEKEQIIVSGVFDQSGLRGLLNRIFDLGFVLISVTQQHSSNEKD